MAGKAEEVNARALAEVGNIFNQIARSDMSDEDKIDTLNQGVLLMRAFLEACQRGKMSEPDLSEIPQWPGRVNGVKASEHLQTYYGGFLKCFTPGLAVDLIQPKHVKGHDPFLMKGLYNELQGTEDAPVDKWFIAKPIKTRINGGSLEVLREADRIKSALRSEGLTRSDLERFANLL